MWTSIINGFYKYVMPFMESNMYVFPEGKSACIIDPHPSKDLKKDLMIWGIEDVTIFLTHEHFDHVSGVWFLRKLLPSVQVIASKRSAEILRVAKNNRPLALLKMIHPDNREQILSFYHSFKIAPIFVDRICRDGEIFFWGGFEICIDYCPGHSPGSVVLQFSNDTVFTGDYMIEGEPVILRYPGGSLKEYEEHTLPFLLDLGNNCKICPGHGRSCRREDLIYEHRTQIFSLRIQIV